MTPVPLDTPEDSPAQGRGLRPDQTDRGPDSAVQAQSPVRCRVICGHGVTCGMGELNG
jgi:hypothetical protein